MLIVDRQKRLVLLGGDPMLAGAFLAKRQEVPDRPAELAERLIVDRVEA
jgi:hypothetical protein